MKKLLFLLLASFLVLAACGNEEEEEKKSEDKKETATKDDKPEKEEKPIKETKAEDNPNENSTWAEAQKEGEDIEDPSEDDGVTTWGNEDPNNLDEVPEGELSENFGLDLEVHMLTLGDVYDAIIVIGESENGEDMTVAIEDAKYQHDRLQGNLDIMPTRNEREKEVKADLQKVSNLLKSSIDKMDEAVSIEDEEVMMSAVEDVEKANKIVENLDIE
ncbi:hypothetical protein M4L90_09870 [Staphylococcus equorum]|uniref:Lipoprotein n=1 Tax=Staphylococcus equorum TaxID=246432 RepID=A0A9X4QZ01_9STAP|nr:hypothetical protein [Staphylococcus equorum]MDG0819881.1 hypothetical protein [Staphylococcus equorum]MDG0840846.1 hypothetical protein [Staphylococcus equorum]MDG0846205.1 hypothetical protein [Staphylococcus equorum]